MTTSAIDSSAKMSVFLGQRNGENIQNAIQGPTMSNVFGTGNNAGTTGAVAASAVAIRVKFNPGSLTANSGSQTITQSITVFGSANSTTSRSVSLYFYPLQQANAGFAGRFVFHGKDGAGNYHGDRDPTTGATGSSATNRGLRSGVIVPDATGIWSGFVILSVTAGGVFTVRTIRDDGTLVTGDTFTPSTYKGNATPTNAVRWGTVAGSTAAWGQYFPGSICDFIQLDGTDGTDAEWQDVTRGTSPSTKWSTNLAAWYRLRSITDLAQTAGTRSYAAATLIGSPTNGTMLSPARSAVTSTDGIHAWPLYYGYCHPLAPADVQGAANLAAVQALTGSVIRNVYIIGAATHVQARAVRVSDDEVVKDWTRVTSSAVTGTQSLTLSGVPVGIHRIEYRREDDTACVSISRDSERVGLSFGFIGQSQMQIMLTDSTSVTRTPPTSKLVSFSIMRGAGYRWTPNDGGIVETQKVLSDAMVAFAEHWETIGGGVPIEIVAMAQQGIGTTEMMYRGNFDSGVNNFDYFGDGTAQTGMVTDALLAKGKRVTGFISSWSTSDQGTATGGATATFPTVYGNKTPTERPWVEKWNELFAGVAKVGAGAPEIADRYNMQKIGLVNRPWTIIMPRSRSRDATTNPASTSTINATTAFRKIMYDYAVSGTGKDSGLDCTLGGHHSDTLLGSTDTEHQDRSDARGNIRFAIRFANALAYACKLTSYSPLCAFTTATYSTNVITVTPTLTNGGSLMVGVTSSTPEEFEVSEDGGTTWSKKGGTIPFTPALSGNTVTLTKTSGNWAAATQVRYLWGYPAAVGNGQIAAETVLTNGMLYESRADAAPSISGLVAGVPLAPSLVAITSTVPAATSNSGRNLLMGVG